MMHPEPIIMTREEHLRHIASYWRQQDADRLREDVLYDDQLRHVAFAMAEPVPSYKQPAHTIAAFALNCMLWIPIAIIGWEIFRP